jgi:hypothetical protein
VQRAPSGRATCKYANCTERTIQQSALKIVPENGWCGTAMGSYHPRCFFAAQDKSSGGTPNWSHTSPFTNIRFPLVLRSSGAPLTRADDIEGFASLNKQEQAELIAASKVQGTGAGTKMKSAKRQFGTDDAEEKPSRKRKSASSTKKKSSGSSSRATKMEVESDAADDDTEQQEDTEPQIKTDEEAESSGSTAPKGKRQRKESAAAGAASSAGAAVERSSDDAAALAEQEDARLNLWELPPMGGKSSISNPAFDLFAPTAREIAVGNLRQRWSHLLKRMTPKDIEKEIRRMWKETTAEERMRFHQLAEEKKKQQSKAASEKKK